MRNLIFWIALVATCEISIQNFSALAATSSNFRNYSALQFYEGSISDEFLQKINPHWLYQEPQSPAAHHAMMGYFILMAIVGLLGNGLVIITYIKSKSVRTPANNFICNLAIADFIIMLEAPLFIYNSLYLGPATGDLGCKIYGLLGAVGGSSAILTLMSISIDRYNVIVYPLNPSRSTTKRKSILMIAIVWIFTTLFSAIPAIELGGVRPYSPEGYLTACSFDYLDTNSANFWFILIYAICAYFIPLTVIILCYVRILRVVLSSKKIQSTKEKNKTEVRLAFVVMGIVGLWLFAWTPYCIVALLGIFGHGTSLSPLQSMFPSMFAKTASCIDPYLYAVTHPRFKAEIEKIFCFRKAENNFQTSFVSRRNGGGESECETMDLNSSRPKPKMKRSESSFCEESTISEQ